MKKIWLSALFAIFALAPSLPAMAGTLADTDLPGGDYRNFSLISPVPSFCENVCAQDSRCKAWTFSWPGKRGKRAKCFLKEKVVKKAHDTCCISGVKGGVALPGESRPEGKPQEPEKAPTPPADSAKPGKPKPEVEKHPLPPVKTPKDGQPRQEQPPAQPQPQEQPPAQPQPQPQPPAQPRQQAEEPQDAPPATEQQDEKRAFCTTYAEQAVRASEENRRKRCGYRGGRWNATYGGYFNWCMKNSEQAAKNNTQTRARLLRQCALRPPVTLPPAQQPPARPYAAPGNLESCRRYADVLSAMARSALRNRCGFFGPEWTTDAGRIFEWCRRTPLMERRAIVRRHRAALMRCTSGFQAAPPPVDAYRPPRPAQGRYLYKWSKLRGPGPAWSTPWRPSRSGKCPLVRNCDCGGGSTCRMYSRGEAALMWPNGCYAQPIVILCNIRRR